MVDIGVLRAMSQLGQFFSRFEWAGRAGNTFEGKRKVYKVCGYKETLEAEDYRDRYERNEIAKRVVDAFPDDTWGGEPEVYDDEDPDTETPFEIAWKELNKRLNIVSVFHRADILARLGRFAVILIGAPGELNTPLGKKISPDKVRFLQPFSELDITVQEMDLIVKGDDERFGLPEYYNIKRIGGIKVNVAKRVHWTRCIHIAEGLLDDNLFGTPTLRATWNRFDDLEKVVGAGSEAFWKRADQGTHVDIDPNIKVDTAAKAALDEELQRYYHGLSKLMKTRGVKINTLGSDVANFQGNVDSILTLISGGQSIPKRILTGSEMGELASTQDRTNWGQRITNRRINYANPVFFGQVINRFVAHGILPAPQPEWAVDWIPLATMDDQERAAIAVQYADINSKSNKIIVKRSEIREILDLESVSDEELDADGEVEDDLVDEDEDLGQPPVNDKVPIPEVEE